MCKSHCSVEARGSPLIRGSSAVGALLLRYKNKRKQQAWGHRCASSTYSGPRNTGFLISWEMLLAEQLQVLTQVDQRAVFSSIYLIAA